MSCGSKSYRWRLAFLQHLWANIQDKTSTENAQIEKSQQWQDSKQHVLFMKCSSKIRVLYMKCSSKIHVCSWNVHRKYMFFNRFLRNFLTVSIFASLTELVSMNAIRFPHFCHCVPSGTPEKSTTCALGRHHLFQAWFDQWHAKETDQSEASVSAPSCSLTSHHHFVSYLFCVRFWRLLKA